MSLNPTAFRRAAIGVSTAAAMGVLALGSSPAAAQQASNGYNGTPACAPFKGSDRAIKCEIEQADLRIRESKLRTEESKVRTEQLLVVRGCTNFLVSGVKDGKFTKQDVLDRAGGRMTDGNACEVARNFGYGRKAKSAPLGPRVN